MTITLHHAGEDGVLKAQATTLVIIDEADHVLFDQKRKLEAGNCICLTATGVNETEALKEAFIRQMGFTILNSSIKPNLCAKVALSPVSGLAQFLQLAGTGPSLVYCYPDLIPAASKFVNVKDQKTISNMQAGMTFFVTEENLMRGIDYQSPG